MSTPTRPLVTIDDPVTIIEPHRVLLEYVDEVHRDRFYVRSQRDGAQPRIGIGHDGEGVVWARGHHLPDSEVVGALRAAAGLEAAKENIGVREKPPQPSRRVFPTAPPPLADSYSELMRKMLEEQTDQWKRAQRKDSFWKRLTGG